MLVYDPHFVALEPDPSTGDSLVEVSAETPTWVGEDIYLAAPLEHSGMEWFAGTVGEHPALGQVGPVEGFNPVTELIPVVADFGGAPGAADRNPYTGNIVRGPNPDGNVHLTFALHGNVVRPPYTGTKSDGRPGPVAAVDYTAQLASIFAAQPSSPGPDNYADVLRSV